MLGRVGGKMFYARELSKTVQGKLHCNICSTGQCQLQNAEQICMNRYTYLLYIASLPFLETQSKYKQCTEALLVSRASIYRCKVLSVMGNSKYLLISTLYFVNQIPYEKTTSEKQLNQIIPQTLDGVTCFNLVLFLLHSDTQYLLQFPLLVLSELEVQCLAVLCNFQVYVLVREKRHINKGACG